ncbi:MAG: neuromedin U [Nitrospiraceae bacterium]|nr:hypothetical protein [Nitrospira sp.]MCB9773958.1 neuromedin U [Nitrospiraceae bacterium]
MGPFYNIPSWRTIITIGITVLSLLVIPVLSMADDESNLAKQTQNPVADLISIPFQNNMNFGLEPNHRTQNVLNIQPVIPLNLTREWNLITRTIMPVIKQPDLRTTNDDTWGVGDINMSLFFSPAKSEGLIWGLGPIFQFPTATDEVLGSRKWAAGPTGVGLFVQGPWVVGLLANNIWSYAGNDDRKHVRQFLAQYFVNYNLPQGWYLTSSPIITANWEAEGKGNKWTVPVGGGVGKVFRIGKLPFNGNILAFSNVVRPDEGADWTLRIQLALLLPKSLFTD